MDWAQNKKIGKTTYRITEACPSAFRKLGQMAAFETDFAF